ncbi:MAG: EAL domain-containing protein [Gallionella sp.]|nr:EAL domain-containing protein [Gallionella sp.]
MPITWNPSLVLLSVLVAIIGSYTALTHAQRMRESGGRTATIWMLAGGGTLGVAIWSMHFIGMLAFHLPIPLGYDPLLTVLSLIPAVLAALLGFRVLRDRVISKRRILISGIFMGVGISFMHYTGMAALKMSPTIEFHSAVFFLSVIIAIVASWGALFIMYRQDWVAWTETPRLLLGSLIMGLAISAMHYTAMLGMTVPADALCTTDALRIEPSLLAQMLAGTAFVWFGGGLLANLFDQRMARKNADALEFLKLEHQALLQSSEAKSQEMIAALRDSEEKWRMTLQNAPDAVFIVEADGDIVYVNDVVVDLLGFERTELCQMTVFDLVPKDWRRTYRQYFSPILSNHERHVHEIRLVTKRGTSLPMELNAVLLPNGRIYGSCRDMSERKAAQRAVQESRQDLKRMMDAISEGMYGVDLQGNCTFVNKALLNILGYEDENEVMGKHMHSLIHHSHSDGKPYPAKDCIMYQAFRINQSVHSDQEVYWRKDGVAVPVEYWSQPIEKDGVVIGAVATFLDISLRKVNEAHIHQLAFYDPLTALANRRLLMERAQQALSISARNGRYGAIILLDLDNFKKLNDTKGHDVGDLLLQEVAARLQTVVREGDTVARLGGDEFVLILEGLSTCQEEAAKHTEMVAEKIRTALSAPYLLGVTRHQSTPSIGVVMFRGHQENIDVLFKYADISMYQAKQAGRNAIRFYDPEMQAAIDMRIELEAELELALQRDELHLYYQIQVDSRRRALGAEVLMRWESPKRGLVSPAQFIPLAEETGLIIPMGIWALRTACKQLKVWQKDSLTADLSLAVNVSAKQFRKTDFVEQVRQVLMETGAKPSHLKLELTESTVLENVEDTIAKMRELRLLGISFSMDDFGTGYSSLSYLKRLPLDQIKIDQTFVRDITTDPNDAAIVQTIIAMTEAMGLNVIAEGVETEEQQEFLELRGCHAFQGYLFSKPVPLKQFQALLCGEHA